MKLPQCELNKIQPENHRYVKRYEYVCKYGCVYACIRMCRRSFAACLPICLGVCLFDCVCMWQWYIFDGHSTMCVHVYEEAAAAPLTAIAVAAAAAAYGLTMYHCYWCSPFLSENTVFGALIWQKCTKSNIHQKSFRNNTVQILTGLQCNNLFQRLWATTVMPWGN